MAKLEDEILKDIEAQETGSEVRAPISDAEQDVISQEADLEREYGDRGLEAGALGTLSGATLGLSDQLLTKSGLVKKDTLRHIREMNKAAAVTGEIAGTIAPLLIPGGAVGVAAKGAATAAKGAATVAKGAAAAKGLGTAAKVAKGVGAPVVAATKVGKAAEGMTASALKKLLKETGDQKFAAKVIAKTIPKAAGSAVEGAAFGTGELIREDALGTAEFNAENLISHAGVGALLGGAAGGVMAGFPAIGSGLSKPLKGVKGKAKEAIKTFADPQEAALSVWGVTPAKQVSLGRQNPAMVKGLADWTVNKAKTGAFTSDATMLSNAQKLRSSAGETIGTTLKRIDEVGVSSPEILPANKLYMDAADDIYTNIMEKYAGKKAFQSKLQPVRNIYDDLVALGQKPGKASVAELQSMRIQMDELAKLEKELGKTSLGEQAARRARNFLRNEIDELAERADSAVDAEAASLLRTLKDANKDYTYTSELIPHMEKKLAKKSSLLSLTDMVAGGAAADLAGAGGAGVVVAAKRLLESDFKRKLTILAHTEKANQQVGKKIGSSIKGFFEGKKAPSSLSSTAALTKSGLSFMEDPKTGKKKKAKSKQEAFENVKTNLQEMTLDPEKLMRKLDSSTVGVSLAAPNTGTAMQDTLMRAVNFLNTKIPQSPISGGGIAAFQRPYQPSDAEMAKFERYVGAVEDPMSLLDDLQNGQATREQVEAIKVVYPDLYERIVNETMNYISDPKNEVVYSKRLQVGALLDIPTDSSLEPMNIASLQKPFVPDEDQEKADNSVNPTVGGLGKLDTAERAATDMQSVQMKS